MGTCPGVNRPRVALLLTSDHAESDAGQLHLLLPLSRLVSVSVTIRRYRDGDRAAVYEVCVETADSGRGVRGRYSTDDLVPDTVAGPYLFLDPGHAYVLDDGGRAVGYVIGTASTPGFVAAYQQRWLPRLRARYRPPTGPPVTEEEHRLDVMFHPERLLLPELAPHPAHLHINLLAGYRGAGHGRELIATFLASVAAAGAPSCYLGVRQKNLNARRFYAKLGWRPVQVRAAEPGTYLVHPTG
jgi:ribosomal protein S18 acetylase RimI-like enzyme